MSPNQPCHGRARQSTPGVDFGSFFFLLLFLLLLLRVFSIFNGKRVVLSISSRGHAHHPCWCSRKPLPRFSLDPVDSIGFPTRIPIGRWVSLAFSKRLYGLCLGYDGLEYVPLYQHGLEWVMMALNGLYWVKMVFSMSWLAPEWVRKGCNGL